MKIIDFEKKGNLVRFYLGQDGLADWGGDDWDDVPYEHNAGPVYDKYVVGHCDIVFPYGFIVLEPSDGEISSRWCKEDMLARRVPCIIAFEDSWAWSFAEEVGRDDIVRFYFGDELEPSEKPILWVEKMGQSC